MSRPAVEAFTADIQAVIEKHWGDLKPKPLDEDLPEDVIEEMGDAYPSAWVLVLGVSSILNNEAPHLTTRYAPPNQLPFTGIGLLQDVLAYWLGPPA